MPRARLWRGMVLSVACVVFGGAAAAANFSFTGSFSTDDQLQNFVFTLASPATVTTVTYSYAGGTNQARMTIPQGGFDPWLAIFDSTGNLLASVDNGTCGQVPPDAVTGACFDSFISQPLSAGVYTLVLSQSDNQPAGNSLADGYTRTGQTDFTSMFGCSNGMFCDINADNRTPNWAVDIDNVTSVGSSNTGVPEPGVVCLTLAGFLGIGLVEWRRRARGSSFEDQGA